MIKKHKRKIALLFCVIGMIMAPDTLSFAVMMLGFSGVMYWIGRDHINEAVGDWWISRK